MPTKTIETPFAQLQPLLRDQITALLSKGENIVLCCEQRNYESFDDQSTYGYVITQQRVAVAMMTRRSGIFSSGYDMRTSSMFLTDIVSVDDAKGKDRVTVWVKGTGDQSLRLDFEEGQVAVKFVKTLREIVNQARTMVSQSHVSPSDRLKELTKMHNEGLITDAEFEQKRKDILNQL